MTLWALEYETVYGDKKPWFDGDGLSSCQGAYLDGKLRAMNSDGFDMFCMTKQAISRLKEKRKGTETVSVKFPNGNVVEATFYFWTHIEKNMTVIKGNSVEFFKEYPQLRGLVVLDSDTERVKYAKRLQRENSPFV